MGLSEQQQAFLHKRQRLLRYWPAASVFLGLAWLGLVGWLWVAHPLLANPMVVQQRLDAGEVADGTVLLLAVMLPVVVNLSLLQALVVVVFVAVAIRNERRYQAILHALAPGRDKSEV
jgi:hypothetical protein